MQFYGGPEEFANIRVYPPFDGGRYCAATDSFGWIPGTYADGESALVAARYFEKFGSVPVPLQDPQCGDY